MKDTHTISCQYSLAEEFWLLYFNHYLYATGTITAKEFKAMIEKIAVHSRGFLTVASPVIIAALGIQATFGIGLELLEIPGVQWSKRIMSSAIR